MPTIHPTAILDGDLQLADDVTVGPHCVLTGPITLGPGTRLIGHVYLTGPLVLGRDNVVYPYACLGFAPQHAKFDPAKPGEGLAIGDGNTFREQVTVHRAFQADGPTRIGDRNTFMVACHVGHDCRVGNDCTLVNGALLAGHVEMQDRSIVSGNSAVHQFCRLGRGAMLSGTLSIVQDIPPFFFVTGQCMIGGINLVGARRAGCPTDVIDDIRWAYRVLYRRGLTVPHALEILRERADRPMIAEYIRFIEESSRGITTSRRNPRRSPAAADPA